MKEILIVTAVGIMILLLGKFLEFYFKKILKETQEIKARQAFSKKREYKLLKGVKHGK